MSYQWLNLAKADGATYIMGMNDGLETVDYSGNGHIGTMHQGNTKPNISLVGSWMFNSVSFGGTSLRVEITASTDFDVTDPWTLEMVALGNAAVGFDSILHYGTDAATNGFQVSWGGANITCAVNLASVTTARQSSVGTWGINEIAHWVFVFSSADITIYKNGAIVSDSTLTPTIINSSTFIMGIESDFTDPFLGSINPVAIYKNVGLTQDQITRHYTATVRPTPRDRSFHRIYRRR